jgi:hypothetical protein
MGKLSKGILGPFSGLVGTVIGSSWKGVNYMRSRPKKNKKAATATPQTTFTLVLHKQSNP